MESQAKWFFKPTQTQANIFLLNWAPATVLADLEPPRAHLGLFVYDELGGSGGGDVSIRYQVSPVLFRALVVGDDLGGNSMGIFLQLAVCGQ